MAKVSITYPKAKNGAGDLGTLTTADYNALFESIQEGTRGITTLHFNLFDKATPEAAANNLVLRKNGTLIAERTYMDTVAPPTASLASDQMLSKGYIRSDGSYLSKVDEYVGFTTGTTLEIEGWLDKTTLGTKRNTSFNRFIAGMQINSGSTQLSLATVKSNVSALATAVELNLVDAGTSFEVGKYISTAQTLSASENWLCVAYGAGLFVALGTAGGCSSSPDGITWTTRTMPSASSWTSVTFGGGLFVALVDGSTTAASSPDGITWTARTMVSAAAWTAVTYGGGLFVAVARGGTSAASSSDGITWTARTLPTNQNWLAVFYGNGTFVAVGPSLANTATTAAASSSDGTTWTAQTMSSSLPWYNVTYGGGLFFATAGAASGASSPDGATWTTRTMPSDQSWTSVAYGDGTFLAITGANSSPNNVAATSPDGINWTARTLSASSEWYDIVYGDRVFVAVTFTFGTAATSVRTSISSSNSNNVVKFKMKAVYGGNLTFYLDDVLISTKPMTTLPGFYVVSNGVKVRDLMYRLYVT